MAAQPTRGRKSADSKPRDHVMASVKLDVATYAKVSAAAALAGVDKSAFMSQAISAAVRQFVIIDRSKKPAGEADLSGIDDRTAA